ncbi:MAG TPA: PAS domain S-box protein [Candidatus Kapabacteria bacterium]|nr:PAS domain S-box protein [Candidatus Kapabacteria bacterium]
MERQLVKRGLNRIILLPIVLSALYAAVLVWQLDRMLDADDWVHHSSQILTLSSETQRHIQFQESALRGYLLTPEAIFLVQFHGQEQIVDSLFQSLHILVLDNPVQTRRLDSVMQLYWTWQSSARHSLSEAAPPADNGSMTAITDSALLSRTMIAESMRAKFRLLDEQETDLYLARTRKFQRGTALLIGIIAVASIVVGIIMGLNARRQTKRFVDRFTEAIEETNRNRDLLETTLLSIDDAIIATGTNKRITLMNSRAEELTGWTKSAAQGRPIQDVFQAVSEDDGTPLENPTAAVLRERKQFQPKGLLKLLSRLGVDYPIELTAAPVHGTQGEIAGIVIVFRDITELRENQKHAASRELEFRALVENTPDVIIRYSSDFTILYANPAVEQVLGLGPQSLIGRRFKDIGIREEVYGPWENSVREVFETGKGGATEVEYRTVRGLRFYHVRLVPEGSERPGENGREISSVISIARDVTELKQTEQRLRESERRFRNVVDNSPDIFLMLRGIRDSSKAGSGAFVDFTLEYLNAPTRQLLPMPAGDIMGRRMSDLMTGPQSAERIKKFAAILEAGVPVREEQYSDRIPNLGGRWYQSRYIPIGDILAISATDITTRMQTIHALERSEERYRRLVEHASEAIFSTDREGRFTYANPYVRELGGYGDADITQYHFTDLVGDEDRERVKRHFFRQFISHTPDSYIEAPFRSRQGKDIWLAMKASLEMHGEQVEGFNCVAMDITERKRIESELRAGKNHEAERAREEREELREKLRQAEHALAEREKAPS